MRLRRFTMTLTASVCLLMLSSAGPVAAIDERIIEAELNRTKANLTSSLSEERSVLELLEQHDKRIMETAKKQAELEKGIAMHRATLADQQTLITSLRAQSPITKSQIIDRLTALYRFDSIDLMNILFTAESLNDLLEIETALNALLEHDDALMSKYLSILNDLQRAEAVYALELRVLQSSETKLVETRAALEAARAGKLQTLRGLQAKKKLFQAAVEELQKVSVSLSAEAQPTADLSSGALDIPNLIVADPSEVKKSTNDVLFKDVDTVIAEPTDKLNRTLQAEVKRLDETQPKARKDDKTAGASFDRGKGQLLWPVAGTITHPFNEPVEFYGENRPNPGVDLAAAPGTKVYAPDAGTITHAEYIRGFGNTIIINHGNNYFTVVARIASETVQKGQAVKAGDVIGEVQPYADTLNEGVHIEVRKKTEFLNPEQWFSKKSPEELTVKRESEAVPLPSLSLDGTTKKTEPVKQPAGKPAKPAKSAKKPTDAKEQSENAPKPTASSDTTEATKQLISEKERAEIAAKASAVPKLSTPAATAPKQ